VLGARRNQERTQASLQLVVVVLVAGAIAWAAAALARKPAEAPELRIVIGELRSQAAELHEVQHEYAAGKLPRFFLREQGKQLSMNHGESRRELARMNVVPELASQRRATLEDVAELTASIRAAITGTAMPEHEVMELRDRLQHREDALRR
jgi:hypothetical protein